jgi:hypothetical protein
MKQIFSSTRQAKRPFVKPCQNISGKIALMAILHQLISSQASDLVCRLSSRLFRLEKTENLTVGP